MNLQIIFIKNILAKHEFQKNNIFVFLNKQQKIKTILLIFLMLIASLIELFSLGTIIVIINTFLEMGKSANLQGGF